MGGRGVLLEEVFTLANELCDAVDCEAEDIGGPRSSGEILRELGPACDAVLKWDKEHPGTGVEGEAAPAVAD